MFDVKWWIIAGVIGILLFMVITRSVKEPLKWMGFGVLYTAIGGLILFVLNWVGQYLHFELPINPITAFITGALGIPGFIYLLVVKFILVG